ncbi:MAG: hypothetical protein Q8O00_11225 [Holophaga sp.]|nr:hypothetical protein [Holophaga sp.]
MEQFLTLLVQAVVGLVLWGLKSTLCELRKDINALRETVWEDTVRKAELAEVKVCINELFSKFNALALKCAQEHGK